MQDIFISFIEVREQKLYLNKVNKKAMLFQYLHEIMQNLMCLHF